MNILAFDTCLDKMYVTLGKDNNFLGSKIVETTKEHYHSAFLIFTITNILKENNITPKDIDVIAINVGPGSFTGIRACTTVARVFAQAANIKTIGVSSLEILSKISPDKEKPVLVALDARKDMAYVAIYEKGKEILAPQTMLLEDLKEKLQEFQNRGQFVICDDKLAPVLGGISYQKQDDDLGKYLLEIASQKIDENCETDWRKLQPLYIQPPPVTIKK